MTGTGSAGERSRVHLNVTLRSLMIHVQHCFWMLQYLESINVRAGPADELCGGRGRTPFHACRGAPEHDPATSEPTDPAAGERPRQPPGNRADGTAGCRGPPARTRHPRPARGSRRRLTRPRAGPSVGHGTGPRLPPCRAGGPGGGTARRTPAGRRHQAHARRGPDRRGLPDVLAHRGPLLPRAAGQRLPHGGSAAGVHPVPHPGAQHAGPGQRRLGHRPRTRGRGPDALRRHHLPAPATAATATGRTGLRMAGRQRTRRRSALPDAPPPGLRVQSSPRLRTTPRRPHHCRGAGKPRTGWSRQPPAGR